MATGALVASRTASTAPMWSMCSWVTTMSLAVRSLRSRAARIWSASSPGSTIIASLVSAQPAMKQFSGNMPVGKPSRIIVSLVAMAAGALDLLELLDVEDKDDGAAHAHLQRLAGRQAAGKGQGLDRGRLHPRLAPG